MIRESNPHIPNQRESTLHSRVVDIINRSEDSTSTLRVVDVIDIVGRSDLESDGLSGNRFYSLRVSGP